ncbi:MAG: VanW family protein [Firmicutes bacterium]|nr:VanW family protein [Bacillota bacterium]
MSQFRNGQRSGMSQRKPVQKKRKRKFPWWTLPIIMVCLCALAWMWSLADAQLKAYDRFSSMRAAISKDAFYGPVYIDDVPMSGLTREEALALLSLHQQAQASAFEVTVMAGDARYSISSAEIPMTWNTEELLDKAYMIGRIGTLEERYQQVQSLKTPVYLNSELRYDKDMVRRHIDTIAKALAKEGKDVSVVAFDVNTRSFGFSDEVAGQRVDAEKLYQTVIEHLDNRVYGAVIPVEIELVSPKITRADLEKNYTRIASFTTKTTADENRNTNIRLGAETVNGTMIAPGATISFNDTTGERTREKGYKEAGAIENGRTVQETGGGICQVATTMFNALVRAGCEIVRRTPHAWPSDYVPRGEDATVDWPRLDLVMRNPSGTPMFLTAWYQDRSVTVEVYGLSLGDGVAIELESETTYTKKPTDTVYTYNPSLPVGTTKLLKKPHTGYSVTTYKVIKQNGQVLSRKEFYKTEYQMISEEYEYNDGYPPAGI